ncbi:FixH family protein [Mucilaginibacter sp. AW1-3]
MDWGKRIVILLIAFVAFISAMSVVMFRQPDEADNQYYEKGLAFDSDYAKEKQVITDHAQPRISLTDQKLAIQFIKPLKGTLHLMRPADEKLDRTFNLVGDVNNQVSIPLEGVAAGRWKLTMNWESNGKKYLYTQEVDVP